jgi:hypothetical protein
VGEKALHLLGPEPVRRGLAAAVMEIAKDPVAIGLLGAVDVAIIAEHLAHLVISLRPGFGLNFGVCLFLTFHNLAPNIVIRGNH